MVSQCPASMSNAANDLAEKPVGGSLPNKKIHGKVPKKIHKAERERLKREQLNELFLELDHALDPSRQNSGKASILGDTARLLQDLLAQVESLKRENAALVSESHYVAIERDELRDENTALETEIEKLQEELWERTQPATTSSTLPMQRQQQQQQTPVRPTAFVVPVQQPYQETGTAPSPPRPSSQVMRPHARYPSSDSWPLQLLSSLPRAVQVQELQLSSTSSSTITASSSVDEGSVRSISHGQ